MKKLFILGIVLALLLIPAIYAAGELSYGEPWGVGSEAPKKETAAGISAGVKAGATGAVRPTYTDYGPDKTRSLTDLPKIVGEPSKDASDPGPATWTPSTGKATQLPSQGTDIANLLPMILGVIGIVIVVVFTAIKIK